ncbi:MAG: WD40/YVTN/BNR-like repeat-containing protein [Pyrinomonadaceae bacterium]
MSYAILFPMCFQVVSCQSSGGPAMSDRHSSVSNASASIINDSDWELRLIEELPKTTAPDHIRCGPDGHCWMWSPESIWLEDKAGRWHQAYKLPSAQRQQLDAIESVSMISPQTGWFITYRGLYQTRDGGISWNPAAGPVLIENSSAFRSVFFRNDKLGWLAGGEDRPRLPGEPIVNNAISADGKEILVASIWETIDGGVTWQAKELKRLIGRFTYMEFWNDMGVAFGDTGFVFTDDGGEKWKDMARFIPQQQETGDRPSLTGAYFIDQKSGWIFTSWFENLSTHDGGKTWVVVRSKVSIQNGSGDEIVPSKVVFADKRRGLLIAGPAGTDKLLKTTDGGRTWFEISADEHFYDVSLAGKEKGFLLGDKGIYSISLKSSPETGPN